jgi:hypothetical protein
MGCGCKKKPKVPTVVITSPEPTPSVVITPQEQVIELKVEDTKEEN